MQLLPKISLDRAVFAGLSLAGLAAAYATSRAGQFTLPQLPHLPALPSLTTLARLSSQIDTGVVLLFVPMCALILAMTFEVLRLMSRGGMPDDFVPGARAIPHWQDEEA